MGTYIYVRDDDIEANQNKFAGCIVRLLVEAEEVLAAQMGEKLETQQDILILILLRSNQQRTWTCRKARDQVWNEGYNNR